VVTFLLTAFLGYLIGRFGHVYLNVWTGNVNWLPHHWIYGILLIIIGIYNWPALLFKYLLFFGVGLFVSDLKDFFELKFFQPDKDEPKRFWDID
jgi:hypothetical protein